MALTGSTIASTYLKLLRANSDTMGADATASYIQDSADTDSVLSISTTRVGIGNAAPTALLTAGAITTLVTDGTTAVTPEGVNVHITEASKYAMGIKNADASGDGLLIQAGDAADDFALRVEDYDSANDLFVVQGGGLVGIGENTPLGKLHVKSGDAGSVTVNAAQDELVLEGSGTTGMTIIVPDASVATYAFESVSSTDNQNFIRWGYNSGDEYMQYKVADKSMIYMKDGKVGIENTSLETWKTTYTALQIGGAGSLSANTNQSAGTSFYMANNAYLDQTDGVWEYMSTTDDDEASAIQMINGSIVCKVTATAGADDVAITFTDALTIANNGQVTTSGDLIVGADVQLANGRGIAFTDTTPDGTSVASETLDDYEEGTWSPVMSDSTNNPSGYADQLGSYTKIGRMVYCSFHVSASGFGTWTTGNFIITGLPFTTKNEATYNPGNIFAYGFKATPTADFQNQMPPNATEIRFIQANNTTATHGTMAADTYVDAGTTLRGTVIYEST